MGPKVFGYIRSSRFDLMKVARLQRELEKYAESEDLALAYIFTDNGSPVRRWCVQVLACCWIRWLILVRTAWSFRRCTTSHGSRRYGQYWSSEFCRWGR